MLFLLVFLDILSIIVMFCVLVLGSISLLRISYVSLTAFIDWYMQEIRK